MATRLTTASQLLATDVTATFDNLAADGVVGPLTAVVVESIRGSAPGGPTRINGLTNAPGLESFVCEDLLPLVESRYQVTADPAHRVLVGHSLGAVAALHLAARHPDQFASVVAGSLELWWPGGDGQVRGADVAAGYLASASRAGRLFLDVGTEEGRLLLDARAFRDELLKGGPAGQLPGVPRRARPRMLARTGTVTARRGARWGGAARKDGVMASLADFEAMVPQDSGLAVLTVIGPDGRMRPSVVNAGVLDHPITGERTVAAVIHGRARKLVNLRERPRASVVLRAGWQWAGVEGPVQIAGPDDPMEGIDAERLKLLLREVFTAAGGTHEDFGEYDRVMAQDRRAVVLIAPERVFSNG